MFYTSKYLSPLGGITLASNGKELTGLTNTKNKERRGIKPRLDFVEKPTVKRRVAPFYRKF